MKITSRDILKLLEKKHADDVFVPECKMGPTATANARPIRLDAWAMTRSWASPYIHGYEIKVTRADFLRDDKWQEYLPACTHFWFVAPAGIIDPAELPKGIGLLECSKNAKRLTTKRKAAGKLTKRIPAEVFKYILMSRTQVVDGYQKYSVDGGPLQISKGREYWEEWLKMKRDNENFGRRLRKKISIELMTMRGDAKRSLKEAKEILDRTGRLETIAHEMGINLLATWDFERNTKKKIEAFAAQFAPEDIKLINEASDKLALLATRMADTDAN